MPPPVKVALSIYKTDVIQLVVLCIITGTKMIFSRVKKNPFLSSIEFCGD